jgi:hypothetical protein
MKNFAFGAGAVLAAGALLCAHSASASEYTYRKIAISGSLSITMYAINATGETLGEWVDQNAHYRTFIYKNRQETDIVVPGAKSTRAGGLNDSGVVVGYYTDSSGNEHGYIYQSHKFQTVDYPDAALTELVGIDNNGDILGYAEMKNSYAGVSFLDKAGVFGRAFAGVYPKGINQAGAIVGSVGAGNASQGVLVKGGRTIGIGLPNGSGNTYALGLNDQDDVVGWGAVSGQQIVPEGIIYHHGASEAVTYAGESGTYLVGINNSRIAVGYAEGNAGNIGFAYDGRRFHPLSIRGGTDVQPAAINNLGMITGSFAYEQSVIGFIATPK